MILTKAMRVRLLPYLLILTACTTPATTPVNTPEALSVTWQTPVATVYTNATVALTWSVTGNPDRMELLDGDAVLNTDGSSFIWDTRNREEGSALLRVRLTRGAQVVESEPRTVVVDRTAPTVIAQTPSNNATDAAFGTPVMLEVSEALSPASVNAQTIQVLEAGVPLSVTPTVSADARQITLPAMPVTSAVDVTRSVTSSGITDLAGNPLAVPAWSWTVPVWQRVTDAIASVANIAGDDLLEFAVGSDAQPVVAWLDTTSRRLLVRRWTAQGWQALGSSDGLGSNAVQANTSGFVSRGFALTVNAAAQPMIAFATQTETPGDADRIVSRVYVKRWDGSNWETLGETARTAEYTQAMYVSMDLDANARPVIAWQEFGSQAPPPNLGQQALRETSVVRAARWEGTAWTLLGSDPINASIAGHAIAPAVQVANDGSVFVAWTRALRSPSSTMFTARWQGQAWQVLDSSSIDDGQRFGDFFPWHKPRLMLNSSNQPVVVWLKRTGTGFALLAHQWTGNTWQALGGTLTESASSAILFDVAFTADGDVLTTFTNSGTNMWQQWQGSAWGMLAVDSGQGCQRLTQDASQRLWVSCNTGNGLVIKRLNR